MKLWYLRQKFACCDHEGEVLAAIVQAENEVDARKCAGNFYCDEGYYVWQDSTKTLCIELSIDGDDPHDIYVDFECI